MPPKFWKSLTDDEWQRIWDNDCDLDAGLCAKLWRMTDRQGPPPERVRVMVSKKDLMRLISKKKR
jgi:hypothetical protein